MKTERLCIVMPVYNEEAAIGGVLRKWTAALDALGIDYTIRPYNDGSRDETLKVMRECAKSSSRIDVRDKPNSGHGPTILGGYRAAAADGFDWIFQIDSDDEMGPEQFGELWSRRADFDFLVGRRAGRVQALPRKIVSFVSRCAVRLFYGKSSIWDVNAPYRLMRVSALREIFASIPDNTFAPNVIITGMVARKRLRALEIPVPQHDRTTGEVSIKKWKLLKAAARSLWQTIWFAKPIVPVAALVPATIALATLNSTTFIWYDELAMSDGVFMKALHGLSWSGVWACSYNPLYPICLSCWVKLFGASHFVVCSFTVLLGYVSTLVIARIAHRRGWWNGWAADLAFVFAFWGGWHFSWILSNARVDILMLLLTTLFADAIAGDSNDNNGVWATLLWSTFLWLASPYMLPVLFAFGVLLLAIAKDRQSRYQLIKRGFVAACGFAFGFIITCLYYYLQQDIIRLLGSYVYFNSITGYNPDPFAAKIARGYMFDYTALAIMAVAWILGGWKRKWLPYTIFVSAIPLLMVLGGRYESYYAWAFYVPAVVLGISVLAHADRRLNIIVLSLGVIACVVHPVQLYHGTRALHAHHQNCKSYIERNAGLFNGVSDVVVASDLDGSTGFYYPLLQQGVHIWYRGPEMLNGRTDEEKFNEGLTFIARNDSQRMILKEFIAKHQRFMPLLPDEGLVVFYANTDVENMMPMFEKRGAKLSPMNADGEFSIWKMSRKQQ